MATGMLMPMAITSGGWAQNADTLLHLRLPGDRTLSWSEAELAALPWHETITHTAYTTGPQHFKGPLLRTILAQGGLTQADMVGRKLYLTALNDFAIPLPASDPWTYDILIAREMNGHPMRLRDKGPLWLVYPRDQHSELQNGVNDERWVWQLSEIAVKE